MTSVAFAFVICALAAVIAVVNRAEPFTSRVTLGVEVPIPTFPEEPCINSFESAKVAELASSAVLTQIPKCALPLEPRPCDLNETFLNAEGWLEWWNNKLFTPPLSTPLYNITPAVPNADDDATTSSLSLGETVLIPILVVVLTIGPIVFDVNVARSPPPVTRMD